jgi:hypothetical protein
MKSDHIPDYSCLNVHAPCIDTGRIPSTPALSLFQSQKPRVSSNDRCMDLCSCRCCAPLLAFERLTGPSPYQHACGGCETYAWHVQYKAHQIKPPVIPVQRGAVKRLSPSQRPEPGSAPFCAPGEGHHHVSPKGLPSITQMSFSSDFSLLEPLKRFINCPSAVPCFSQHSQKFYNP